MLRKQVVCGCNASRIQIDRAYSKVDRSRHATCTILADISIPKLFQGVPPCINSTNMNQQKALEATSELTIFLMQLQGEEGPETNLLQLDTCWWGAMSSKCASGKVIKADKPGGRMHWLLRSGSNWRTCSRDIENSLFKFDAKFTGIYTWDEWAIYGNTFCDKDAKVGSQCTHRRIVA